MKRLVLLCAVLLTCSAGTATANYPGSTGIPEKGCKPIRHGLIYVGATRMGCRNAREIASKGLKGKEPPRWKCTGLGTSFGHCHGKRGRIAHWAVND